MNPFERIDQLTKEKHSMEIAALKLAVDYDALKSDLASVTAERQNWKEWAEEARAMFHKQIDAAAVMKTRAEQAEQRVAELVAALDDLLGCPTVTDRATCPDGDPSRIDEAPEWQAVLQISCAWTRYKKLKALARAESATPDKHPDTEIVDWLEDNTAVPYCAGLYDSSPDAAVEIPGIGVFVGETLRAAIDAARKALAESGAPLPMREDPRYRGTDFRSALDVDRASQGGGK